MAAFELVSPFQPEGDQPQAIEKLVDGLRQGRAASDADGCHRLGQDVHDGQRDRAIWAAGPGHVAQQDAGRSALCRVQGVLSQERGPLLRQLLRLLPARGLHSPARHLHRKRRRHQSRDRAAPAGEHQCARQSRRRSGRGQRLVHLRLGIARRLSQNDGPASVRRPDRPRPTAPQVRRYPV